MKNIIHKYLKAEGDSLNPVINGIVASKPEAEKIVTAKSQKICFVDGGSCSFFETPSLCIGKVRIAKVWFDGKQKIKHQIKDYDIVAYFDRGWKAQVNNELLQIAKSDITEYNRENISRIIGIVRRFLELQALENNSVLDGSLEPSSELDKQVKLPLTVFGLSKTNSIRTKQGNSYTYLLNKKYVEPFVLRNVIPEVNFAKFMHCPYVWRIDGKLTDDVLYSLQANSKDPAFKGYPYGLVVADKLARISDYEKKAMRVKLFHELGSADFRELLASSDAHEFLDMQNIY